MSDESNWSTWNKRSRTTSDTNVRIYSNGSLAIPDPLLDAYFDDDDGAILHSNTRAKQIGIEPGSEGNAYKISRKNRNAGLITCNAFLQEHGIDVDSVVVLPTEWDSDLSMLVIDYADLDT